METSSTNSLGDVQLVSSSSAVVENENVVENKMQEPNINTSALVSNEETDQQQVDEKTDSKSNESVQTANQTDNYFAELKMERAEMYSKSIETYQKIIDSENVSSEQKSIAIQEIDKINQTQNAIQIAEELIKLKGFDDAVIYSANDKISVIIRIAALSEPQVAQIQNIVSKELGVAISDITISNK